MSLHQLSRQMEQDVSYLRWRAQTHQQSDQELLSQFSNLADSYRRLVKPTQQDQLELLIDSYRARL